MPAGRPRKSARQHEFEGTYRPRNHDGRSGPKEDGQPVKPADLTPLMAECWDAVVRPWMVEHDTVGLVQLCKLYELKMRVEKFVDANPNDKNARCNYLAYQQAFDKLASKFGYTSSDRARLDVSHLPDEDKDGDAKYFGVVG